MRTTLLSLVHRRKSPHYCFEEVENMSEKLCLVIHKAFLAVVKGEIIGATTIDETSLDSSIWLR